MEPTVVSRSSATCEDEGATCEDEDEAGEEGDMPSR
jgi:hypothetical protein